MASIIWKSIYPLTNEAANYLAERGEIVICTHNHDGVMLSELPVFHPEGGDPTPLTLLEMVKRGHEAVGATEEEVSDANRHRYFDPAVKDA